MANRRGLYNTQISTHDSDDHSSADDAGEETKTRDLELKPKQPPTDPPNPPDPRFRIINTKLSIDYLSQLDTASRSFRCNVKATMDWSMNDAERLSFEEKKKDPQVFKKWLKEEVSFPLIIPEIGRDTDHHFVTDPKVTISHEKDHNGDHQFHSVQSIHGEWEMDKDRGELDDFPGDREILPMKITTLTAGTDRFRILATDFTHEKENDDLTHEKENEKEKLNGSFVQHNIMIFPVQSQEFDCYMAEIKTMVEASRTNKTYDGVIFISIHAKRKWAFYFKQVVVFVFIQSLLLLPGYAIDIRDVGDRLGYFVTLLLTQTALLYFVDESLPKLSYYHVLDEYIIWNYELTLLVSVQTALLTMIEDDETAELVDFWCLIGFSALFLCINLTYIVISWWRSRVMRQQKYNPEFIKHIDESKCVKEDRAEDYYILRDPPPRKGFWASLYLFIFCCCGSRYCLKCCQEVTCCCDKEGGCYQCCCWVEKVQHADKGKKLRDEHTAGGVCVYYDDSGKDHLGEYRHWDQKNEKFDYSDRHSLEEMVILFGKYGTYQAEDFYAQNKKDQHRRFVKMPSNQPFMTN